MCFVGVGGRRGGGSKRGCWGGGEGGGRGGRHAPAAAAGPDRPPIFLQLPAFSFQGGMRDTGLPSSGKRAYCVQKKKERNVITKTPKKLCMLLHTQTPQVNLKEIPTPLLYAAVPM